MVQVMFFSCFIFIFKIKCLVFYYFLSKGDRYNKRYYYHQVERTTLCIVKMRKSQMLTYIIHNCYYFHQNGKYCVYYFSLMRGSPNCDPRAGTGPPARPIQPASLFQSKIIIRPAKPLIISYLCCKPPTVIIVQVTIIQKWLRWKSYWGQVVN